jgi:hypothetical protein
LAFSSTTAAGLNGGLLDQERVQDDLAVLVAVADGEGRGVAARAAGLVGEGEIAEVLVGRALADAAVNEALDELVVDEGRKVVAPNTEVFGRGAGEVLLQFAIDDALIEGRVEGQGWAFETTRISSASVPKYWRKRSYKRPVRR